MTEPDPIQLMREGGVMLNEQLALSVSLEQYRRMAEFLAGTMAMLNAARPLDEVLKHIVAQACELMNAQACIIHRINDETQFVEFQVSIGLPEKMQQINGFPLHSSADDESIILRKPVVVPALPDDLVARTYDNPASDPGIQAWREGFVETYRAWLALPLVINDAVYGSLALYYVTPQRFGPEKIERATLFADQVALALENARLHHAEQRQILEAERRQRVAESLRDTLKLLNAERPLQEILDHIVAQAKLLLDAGACVLHRVNMQTGMAYRQASAGWPTEILTQTQAPYASFGEDYARMLILRQPIYGNYGPLSERLRVIEDDKALPEVDRQRRLVIRRHFAALLAHPLVIRGSVYGCMLIYYKEPQTFSPEQIALAGVFVEQAAMAIENVRLHESEHDRRIEAEQRRRVAEGLRDILAILNSSRPLPDILNYIAMQATQLLSSKTTVMYRFDHRHDRIDVVAGHNLPEEFKQVGNIPLYQGGTVQNMLGYEPDIIPDIQAHLEQVVPDLNFDALQPQLGQWLSALYRNFHAYLGVPLSVGNELYGCLALYYDEVRQIPDEELRLALTFSDQAALAIENARLYEQVQETAAVAERNRLARDLHDSVTQTLFSASLIAKVLPRLWERDQEEGWRRLEELHQLTRGALAEMRTLLLELRPAALADTDLPELLRHLVEAAIGRAGIPVTLEVECNQMLMPDAEVKLTIYRIAQEALNNLAKHADADHAVVELQCDGDRLTLCIVDDGVGFDPQCVSGDHFGLKIMRERANAIGGTLMMQSSPGEGTRIELTCVCKQQGEKG